MRLEANKSFTYLRDAAQLQCRVADRPISQFKKMRQLRLVEFAHTLAGILRENEIQKGPKLWLVLRGDERPAGIGAFLPGDRREREAIRQRLAGIRQASQCARLVLVLEQRRQLTEQARDRAQRVRPQFEHDIARVREDPVAVLPHR